MDSGVARKKIDIEEYHENIRELLGPTKKIIRNIQKDLIKRRKQKHKKKPDLNMKNTLTH